jgi:hypothetical protein
MWTLTRCPCCGPCCAGFARGCGRVCAAYGGAYGGVRGLHPLRGALHSGAVPRGRGPPLRHARRGPALTLRGGPVEAPLLPCCVLRAAGTLYAACCVRRVRPAVRVAWRTVRRTGRGLGMGSRWPCLARRSDDSAWRLAARRKASEANGIRVVSARQAQLKARQMRRQARPARRQSASAVRRQARRVRRQCGGRRGRREPRGERDRRGGKRSSKRGKRDK